MLDLRETDPAPADHALKSANPRLRVLMAAPRGFCAGVRRAIEAVEDAIAAHGAPVYVRRPIVHNLQVVRDLEAQGAIFVEEIDQVPTGSVVIFSAHGVSPAVATDAQQRGLVAFDAVCPLVAKVHREVERHRRNGRQVILIGHADHPEITGTLGHIDGGGAHVLNSVSEVESLPIGRNEPAAYAVQTTYSVDDASAIVQALRERFADLAEPASSDICYATTNRQAAVREIAAQADSVIVAGESFSSNACRLAEVASVSCASVQLIANADELDWSMISNGSAVAITAAASTPESTVQEIVAALASRFSLEIEEVGSALETTVFKPLAVA